MRKILLCALVVFALTLFAETVPNLSGTWKLDRDASTGEPAAKGASLLAIKQSDDDLAFDYFAANNGQRGKLLQTSTYVTDGIQHSGYKIRTYVTYVRAYWRKSELVVQTKAVLDPDGYQTFTTEDHWSLSQDGNTLTDKSSDGTRAVYTRQPEPEP